MNYFRNRTLQLSNTHDTHVHFFLPRTAKIHANNTVETRETRAYRLIDSMQGHQVSLAELVRSQRGDNLPLEERWDVSPLIWYSPSIEPDFLEFGSFTRLSRASEVEISIL